MAPKDGATAPGTDPAEDRRRHPRAAVDLQVSLRFPSVQQFLSACAGDISESGMFIRADSAEGLPREAGQLVALRFDAGHERIVQGTARVVRVVGGGEPGIAVEFVDLDDTSRRLVEMIVRIKLSRG